MGSATVSYGWRPDFDDSLRPRPSPAEIIRRITGKQGRVLPPVPEPHDHPPIPPEVRVSNLRAKLAAEGRQRVAEDEYRVHLTAGVWMPTPWRCPGSGVHAFHVASFERGVAAWVRRACSGPYYFPRHPSTAAQNLLLLFDDLDLAMARLRYG